MVIFSAWFHWFRGRQKHLIQVSLKVRPSILECVDIIPGPLQIARQPTNNVQVDIYSVCYPRLSENSAFLDLVTLN
jgi:hypothetical protein